MYVCIYIHRSQTPNNHDTPASRVLLVVLLLTVFLGDGFLLFRMLRKKNEEGTLFLLLNDDGTYRVEEPGEKEAYQNGRKERMDVTPMPAGPTPTTPPPQCWEPGEMHVPINTSLLTVWEKHLEMDIENICPPGTPRRTVRDDSTQDQLWFMQKLHQDFSFVSVDDLRSSPIVSEVGEFRIVRENPLTIRSESGQEQVIGRDGEDWEEDLKSIYPIILLVYKLAGRPLPKPDSNEDYRERIWKICVP